MFVFPPEVKKKEMAVNLPPCPASMKPIAHYLKAAQEHDQRDVIVSYWCRLYALQMGLKLTSKQPDETALLIGMHQSRFYIFENQIIPHNTRHNGMAGNGKKRTRQQRINHQ